MKNTIKKLTVNIYANNVNSFKNIEYNIDLFINQYLIKYIGIIIQKYEIQDTSIEIKNLNLDIDLSLFDNIHYDTEYFINNIKEQLSFALENEIENFLKKYASKKDVKPLTDIKYNSLENFFTNGNLEWWVDKDNKEVIQNLYNELLTNKNLATKLTAKIFKKQDSIKRFSYTISNQDIEYTASILMNTDLNIIKEYSLIFSNYLSEIKFFRNLNNIEIAFIKNLFLVFLINNQQNFSFKELFIYTKNQYNTDLNFNFLSKNILKSDIKNKLTTIIENLQIQNSINNESLNDIKKNDKSTRINRILTNLDHLQSVINIGSYTEKSSKYNSFQQNYQINNSYTDDNMLEDLIQQIILELKTLRDEQINLLSDSNKIESNALHKIIQNHDNIKPITTDINTNFQALKKQLISTILNINNIEFKLSLTSSLLLLINSSYKHIYNGFINEINSNTFSKNNIFDLFLSITLSGIIENRTTHWYQIQAQNLITKSVEKKTEFIKKITKKQSNNPKILQINEINTKKNNADLYKEFYKNFNEQSTEIINEKKQEPQVSEVIKINEINTQKNTTNLYNDLNQDLYEQEKEKEFFKEIQKKQTINLEKSQKNKINTKKNNNYLYENLKEYFYEKKIDPLLADSLLKNILQIVFSVTKSYKDLIAYINEYVGKDAINETKTEILIKKIISIRYNINEKDITKTIEEIDKSLLKNKKEDHYKNDTKLNTLIFFLNQSSNCQNFNSIIENFNNNRDTLILYDNIKFVNLINIISEFSNQELKIFFRQNLPIDIESIEIPNKIINFLLLNNKNISFKDLKELIWTDFISLITKENNYKNTIISKKWQENIVEKITLKFKLDTHEIKKNICLFIQTLNKQKQDISKFEKTDNGDDIEYINFIEELIFDSSNNNKNTIFVKEQIFQILKKNTKLEILKTAKNLKSSQQIIINEIKEFLNRNRNLIKDEEPEIFSELLQKLDAFLKKNVDIELYSTKINKNLISHRAVNHKTIDNSIKNKLTNNKTNKITIINSKNIDTENSHTINEIVYYEDQYVFAKKILSFFTSIIKDVSPIILLEISIKKILNKLVIKDFINKKEFNWKNEVKIELLQLSSINAIQLDLLLLKIEKFIIKEIIIPLNNKLFKKIDYPKILIKEPENNVSKQINKKKESIKDYNKNKKEKNKTYYLNNASIVIIYPFIEDLFKQLNLLQNKKFKDEVSHFNAIHIINYLCTNELFAAEWDLVILKILLGFKPSEFIYPKYIPKAGSLIEILLSPTVEKLNSIDINNLEEIEKEVLEEVKSLIETCDTFILNIIKKWESLNNLTKYKEFQNGINANNFKEYFLYRTCIVQYIAETQEPFWHITIPPYAYDNYEIFPPWAIDFVVLPWTKEKIIINWNN